MKRFLDTDRFPNSQAWGDRVLFLLYVALTLSWENIDLWLWYYYYFNLIKIRVDYYKNVTHQFINLYYYYSVLTFSKCVKKMSLCNNTSEKIFYLKLFKLIFPFLSYGFQNLFQYPLRKLT